MAYKLHGVIEPVIPEDPSEDYDHIVYPTRRRKCNNCKQYPNLLYKEVGENYIRLYLYKCACTENDNVVLRWDPVQVNAFQNWIDQEPYRTYTGQ